MNSDHKTERNKGGRTHKHHRHNGRHKHSRHSRGSSTGEPKENINPIAPLASAAPGAEERVPTVSKRAAAENSASRTPTPAPDSAATAAANNTLPPASTSNAAPASAPASNTAPASATTPAIAPAATPSAAPASAAVSAVASVSAVSAVAATPTVNAPASAPAASVNSISAVAVSAAHPAASATAVPAATSAANADAADTPVSAAAVPVTASANATVPAATTATSTAANAGSANATSTAAAAPSPASVVPAPAVVISSAAASILSASSSSAAAVPAAPSATPTASAALPAPTPAPVAAPTLPAPTSQPPPAAVLPLPPSPPPRPHPSPSPHSPSPHPSPQHQPRRRRHDLSSDPSSDPDTLSAPLADLSAFIRPADTPPAKRAKRRHEDGFFTRLLAWRPLGSAFAGAEEKISRREKCIGFFVVLALLTSAVLFGSANSFKYQLTALGISAAAFLFLFVPMFDKKRSRTPLESAFALVNFPLFWLGLALFALMLAQGLNPAWTTVIQTSSFRITPLAQEQFIPWLPTGVDAPLSLNQPPNGMNAFRQMVIFGSPWLLLCALWAGVRRRKAFAGIAWAVVTGGLLLVSWGVLMRLNGTHDLLGKYTMANTSFFATFLYQNHAGAWIALLFGLAVALALWHWSRATTLMASGGPHLLGASLALCFALASVCTLSFGSMLTIGVVLFIVVPVAILWHLLRKGVSQNALVGGALASALLALLALAFYATTDLQVVESKLTQKFNLVEKQKIDDRVLFREATWKMLEDKNYNPVTGWGAGSYRWVSPPFYQKIPDFQPHGRSPGIRSNFALCDWLQMAAEWGAGGLAIVAAAFLWMAGWLLMRIRRWTPATLVLTSTLLLFIGHAWMDFLNYSIPLLSLVALVAVATAKFSLSERKTSERTPKAETPGKRSRNSNGGNANADGNGNNDVNDAAADSASTGRGHGRGSRHHHHHHHHGHSHSHGQSDGDGQSHGQHRHHSHHPREHHHEHVEGVWIPQELLGGQVKLKYGDSLESAAAPEPE